ncbi:hypothetical protein SSX86_007165 [Deinandra increscens subsp. villosa]|uniref:Protein BIG GRAIN 1-like E n=1 Tax=Deinandra increscens subsp. villosa TaxID=3103831 RepID=A0AAP0DKX3_9ASTR
MPKTVPSLQENKKPFHRRNGSGEIHVFESARYFESVSNNTLAHKHYMREGVGRLSLDIPNPRRNSIPLQALMTENRNSLRLQNVVMDQTPMMIKNDKKHKHPSSPGGKLAHFLNSLFNQTSSKKSKSKSKSNSSAHSMKDEDESPSGWRRKRSSISLFRSGNSNSTMSVSDTKSSYSRTLLSQPPTKSSTYRDPRTAHSDNKPASEITKIPLNENHNKNENLMIKSGVSELKRSSGIGLLEKVRVCDVKHDDDHKKHDPTVEIRELKSFILDDDDGGDSDSSSDLFELTNCDLGYYPSGLPVFETTHMDSIKRGAPISS